MGQGGKIVLNLGQPQPKQREFLTAKERYILYGGARGGGKSWAVRFKAIIMALYYAGIRILILRRTYPELEANHITPLRKTLLGVADYNDSKKLFTFPNGSTIKFWYCDTDQDALRLQGQEFDEIFIDEAEQITESQYDAIRSCLRGTADIPRHIFLTANPGGPGHSFLKRLFVDREYREGENPDDYRFIPAGVRDNEILMRTDPDYLRTLETLPPTLRRAWLDGDWNLLDDTAYFSEFASAVHIVQPYDIPTWWKRFRAIDYGLDALACVWVALSDQGEAVVYRAIKQPNLIVSAAADAIKAAEADGEQIAETYFPPDLRSRQRDTGKTQIELFADAGISGAIAANDRVAGWLALHEWLKPITAPDGEGLTARLRIFSTCTGLIKDLTSLQHDTKNPTDAATEPHEITHLPDALRYFAIMHQRNPVMPETEEQRRAKELAAIKRRAISGRRSSRMV